MSRRRRRRRRRLFWCVILNHRAINLRVLWLLLLAVFFCDYMAVILNVLLLFENDNQCMR
jgi:hypothetical protein